MTNSINCNVNSCRHNDQARHCTLNSVTVGCSTATPHACCDTECDSFEENC
ncbi:MAG: DUF1540 domain-containing protein [Defluviitaleaceae bacterium]|nr:DUF1540 domain-containing protein [Defluviitaleaceae bacterium]